MLDRGGFLNPIARLTSVAAAVVYLVACGQEGPTNRPTSPGDQAEQRTPADPARRPNAQGLEVRRRDELLAAVSRLIVPESLCASSDSRHVAFVVAFPPDPRGVRQSQLAVVVDGRVGKRYDEIKLASLTFSPDGKRHAYAAKSASRWIMVVDETESRPYHDVGRPRFSPDNEALAFRAKDLNKEFVVRGEGRSKEYDHVFDETLVWSPHGKRLAFAATRASKSLLVIQEDQRSMEYTGSGATFNRSGQLAHIASLGADGMQAVVAEHRGPKVSYIAPESLAFCPDGSRLAYAAYDGLAWQIIVDDKPGPAFFKIRAPGPVWSPDGKHLAYIVWTRRGGGKWQVVRDGEMGKAYDGIAEPGFALGQSGREPLPDISRRGEWSNFVQGVEGVQEAAAGPGVVFSHDGERFAYAARIGKDWFAVVDGVESRPFATIAPPGPAFSLDGEHVAYKVMDDGWSVCVDGMKASEHVAFVPNAPLVFDGPDQLHALAVGRATGIILTQLRFGPR